jgi:hypothetical protein
MLSITRTFAKLCIVPLASLAFLGVTPIFASSVVFTANPPAGSDSNPCSFASPCQTLEHATQVVSPGGQVTCAQGTAFGGNVGIFNSMTIDCPDGVLVSDSNAIIDDVIPGSYVFRVRNLVINGQFAGAGLSGVTVTHGGTVIFENCVFENFSGAGISITPSTFPTTIILRNTRIVNNGSGVLFKPTSSAGTINAVFDHVTVSGNVGGGIKVDSTNAQIDLDINDSVISSNGGNGINAVGAANQNMVSIKNSVIAKNAVAGVQANGASAGMLVQTTLLDQNASGATSVVNGAHISTYGNNSIVGSSGSGFTGTASLQ